MLNLTEQNYYSREANQAYLSNSQYKKWLDCPARTAAVLRGEWIESEKQAFVVGKYVDCALLTPDNLHQFKAEYHDAIYTKSGSLRSDFEQAESMIARCKRDPAFMSAITGTSQVIAYFRFAGAMWKVRMDNVDPDRGILADLKTAKSLDEKTWSDEAQSKVPFYEVYGYWTQFSVYRMAYKSLYGKLPKFCLLPVVTKQTPPIADVLIFDNKARFDYEAERIKANVPRIIAWKSGKAVAPRCERCEYCRDTYRITEPKRAESCVMNTITLDQFAGNAG